MTCRHVYEYVGAAACPACGRDTHEIDWQKSNDYHRQWRIDNPNATSDGWWSI